MYTILWGIGPAKLKGEKHLAGTRKQKETTKQSQASARTKSSSKTTLKSAQTSTNKTTKTETRSSAKKRTPEPEYEEGTSFLQSEAVILGAFAVCVLLFLSNFHICGFLGNFFSQIMLGVFGCIGYLAPLLLFAELLFYASNKGNIRAVYKMIAVEVLLIVLCGLAQLVFGADTMRDKRSSISMSLPDRAVSAEA